MGLNDLAMELLLNTQTENSDSTRFCVPNPTANKIRKWDLPSLITLNARSLNSEKVDELHVTVATHDVSMVCVRGRGRMLTNYTVAPIKNLRRAPGFGVPRHIYISFYPSICLSISISTSIVHPGPTDHLHEVCSRG